MVEFLEHLVDAPVANVIVLVGLGLLAVAALGKVTASINPTPRDRVIAGVLGVVLVIGGLGAHNYVEAHSKGDAQRTPKVAEPKVSQPKVTEPKVAEAKVVERPPVAAPPPRLPPRVAAGCQRGYLWRGAFPGDLACVSPEARARALAQNQLGPTHVAPRGGPYGPDTCRQGFVWRDARPGDHVCVTPMERQQAALDNQAAQSHTLGP